MDKIDEILNQGVENVIPSKERLKEILLSGKKLNIYLGIDPTATKIHLGHAVQLRRLQSFADLGHKVTFLIGDFTALIGDTSDKDKERPVLSSEQIQENFKTYKKQAEKILDFSKIDVKFNSQWLEKLNLKDLIKLTQHFSFGDFASRELIKNRLQSGKKVGLHEALYPVLQGYDSYFMDTDIQIGGTDQTFNMQAGRTLQKDLREKESFVITTSFLMGTDGRKMSKSEGNAIWLEDSPEEMYGKIMSIKDELIHSYFILATSLPLAEVEKIEKEDPLYQKTKLAETIVNELHNKDEAQKAKENFKKIFQEKKREFIPIHNLGTLQEVVAPYTSLATISDAKRLIYQGGVDLNGQTIKDPKHQLSVGDELIIGKRTFIKIEK
ncbi:tyrosine--tRNA ligase [Candidatus Woesebacteria bacterium]|nr:tyrosine--tRNA ligase [Candidatus Woesebacteria bacterium]QQG47254.1 MAG: tyrosine--tRNA ligase [Candidatus Woesebacteria bacterium]